MELEQPQESAHEVTELLGAWRAGDTNAYRQMIPLVYEHLRRIAGGVAQQSGGVDTQATAIVHELFLKLVKSESQSYENRVHFYSAAARAMRQILIDRSRREMAGKRGGGAVRAEWNDAVIGAATPSEQLVALDDALGALSANDERMAELVELRHFGGMTLEEIGTLRGVSAETVRRQLRLAEAWLGSYMKGDVTG